MHLRKCAGIFGWAVAYYVGGGLLFILCLLFGGVFWLFNEQLSPEGPLFLIFCFPLLFSFVAMYHGCTGKWERLNYYLRQTSLMVLWVIAFYLGYFAFLFLLAFGVPHDWLEPLGILVFLAPFVGGLAGSLCWRGKLPGTRMKPAPGEPTESEHAGEPGTSDLRP